jgi:nucleotide-binding universal stress UspA family protein
LARRPMIRAVPFPRISGRMSTKLIVSYDGTVNDDDAVALAKALARSGAQLALAYVRHAREFDPRREELAQHDAERRLEQGAALLEDPETPRHVIVSPSTGEGLQRLAEAEAAPLIVFGSDYRTPPGHAEPGTSAQHLLEGGPLAIAVAAAGLRTESEVAIKSIAIVGPGGDSAAVQTAEALAAKLDAAIVAPDAEQIDLLVVGSQPNAPAGRIAVSGAARERLNRAEGSVLVVPRGKPVQL